MKETSARNIAREVHDAYNAIAGEFDATRRNIWPELEALAHYVHEGDRVLDAGCGNGRITKLLDEKNVLYTGIDVSEEQLVRARKNFPDKTFLQGSLLNIPFPDASFDAVWCVAVLHHIPGKENRERALRELYRVLRPGGVFIATSWFLFDRKHAGSIIKSTAGKLLRMNTLDFSDIYVPWNKRVQRYYHCFTLNSLKRLIARSGFSIVRAFATESKSRNLVVVGKKEK